MSHLPSDPQMLSCALLDWRNEQPVAREYDDVYASQTDALAEKTHVFLAANQLQQRIAQLQDQDSLHILELGFGTGANFLLTWQLWQQLVAAQTNKPSRLVYVSIEGIPVMREDLIYCHQQWPSIQSLSLQLQQHYPIPIKGWHSLVFGDVTLVLILAGVEEAVSQLQGRFDVVYLDGFNPAKNPAMWQSSVLQHVARCCDAHTSLSTYSVARKVKDNLHQAGFEFELLEGYGRKRHMLKAKLKQQGKISSHPANAHQNSFRQGAFHSKVQADQIVHRSPWQALSPPYATAYDNQTIKHTRVAVIGAGIAGCTTAAALQQRGYQVQLIEQGNGVAQRASGNRLAALYTNITRQVNLADAFFQQALLYALQQLNNLERHNIWSACGLLQVADNLADMDYHKQVCQRGFPSTWLRHLNAEQASQLAGCKLPYGGLWLPCLGWVKLAELCTYWMKKLHLSPWFKQKVTALTRVNSTWQLTITPADGSKNKSYTPSFDIVVLCNAYSAGDVLANSYLPMRAIRGQISYLKHINTPPVVLCGNGYITPKVDNMVAVGASYNLHNNNPNIDMADHASNIDKLDRVSLLAPNHTRVADDGWVGFRAVTPDRLPMVGALVDTNEVKKRFSHLRKDKKYLFNQTVPWLNGLYVNLGHGSKGLVSAPISAQLLTAQIAGDTWPLPMSLGHALNPNRFLFRDMMRNKV